MKKKSRAEDVPVEVTAEMERTFERLLNAEMQRQVRKMPRHGNMGGCALTIKFPNHAVRVEFPKEETNE